MADWPIPTNKTAMLFFDCYNAALHPKDPVRQARIEKLGVIPRMAQINEACREAGIPVFYAQADHRPDNMEFNPVIVDAFQGRPKEEGPFRTIRPGNFSGTPELEIIPEIAPQPGDYVIKKHRWSTFYQTWFELALRSRGIDTIMIAGGAIGIGIASTAYSARDAGFNLIILSDVMTAPEDDEIAFFVERVFPGFARIRTVAEAIALFEKA